MLQNIKECSVLLSTICIDLVTSLFPSKALKSDFSRSLVFTKPTIQKDIYLLYFQKIMWERREGSGRCGAKTELTYTLP